jgi:hypothetical protein
MDSLTKELKQYTKKVKELSLPYLWKKWGVEPEVLTNSICELWETFENPHMVDELLKLNVDSEPRFREICDTKYKRGKHIENINLHKYQEHNIKEDQHQSVYLHDERWVKNYKETGKVSCSNTNVMIDTLWLELDRTELRKARDDVLSFMLMFPHESYYRVFYSGNRGFHIQVDGTIFGSPIGSQHKLTGIGKLAYNLAHETFGDIRHNNDIKDVWLLSRGKLYKTYYDTFGVIPDTSDEMLQKTKQELENIDPNIYYVNSLIRQPYSIHEKSGNKKSLVNIYDLTSENYNTNKKILDFNNKKPYLIHRVYDCLEPRVKFVKSYDNYDNEDEIINFYGNIFNYFDPEDANNDGWVNNLYSPFYEDTSPSVAVNIKTGHYKDFGELTHSFSIFEVYSKIYKTSIKTAKEKLK